MSIYEGRLIQEKAPFQNRNGIFFIKKFAYKLWQNTSNYFCKPTLGISKR
jgi:hypothetical protein